MKGSIKKNKSEIITTIIFSNDDVAKIGNETRLLSKHLGFNLFTIMAPTLEKLYDEFLELEKKLLKRE